MFSITNAVTTASSINRNNSKINNSNNRQHYHRDDSDVAIHVDMNTIAPAMHHINSTAIIVGIASSLCNTATVVSEFGRVTILVL